MNRNVIERIEQSAVEYPERIAYIHREEAILYRELWNRVCDRAELLKRQGRGTVLLYGHKSVEMVVSILACLRSGRTYLPIDCHTPEERIRPMIPLAGVTLCLAHEPISTTGIQWTTPEDLEACRNQPELEITKENAYIIFTSGSTGNAKGVPISQENLQNFVAWIETREMMRSSQPERVLNQASFSFDLSVADFYYALCNGHTLVALDREQQENYNELFRVLREERITLCVLTPTFLKLCLLEPTFDCEHYPDLRGIYFCGEQLEKKNVEKLFARFPHLRVFNAYGPTEATSAVSGVEITAEDLQNGEELLPVGEENTSATEISVEQGEIVLRGKSVFSGYLAGNVGGYFQENGQNGYRTGDMGYWKNGKLYCKGRFDDQIKYKGYRIELGDIEYNLQKIAGVVDGAVVAKYGENGMVRGIRAFVVLENGMTVEMVRDELKKRIPAYMVPSAIEAVEELPRNANQKTDRKKLSQQ